MEFSEQVLILRVGKFKEADLWVRFLSPTHGLLTAFAFGGSRSRRRFIGCLDIFNEVSVKVISSGRGAYLALTEGVLVKGLSRLRTDSARLGVAANCAAFLQSFGVGPEGAGTAHFLLQQTLQLLEENDVLPDSVPFFFRARLVFDQGYALQTGYCSSCGKKLHEDTVCFFVREGRFACRSCSLVQSGQRLFLRQPTLETLAQLHMLPPVSWGELQLPASEAKECVRAIDGFIQYHIGITWNNGRFVRL